MAKNSRQKGARGEREAADFLRRLGFAAERAARTGVKDGEDLIVHDLPRVHVECKRVEALDLGTALLDAAIKQAIRACDGKRPCVLWRPNNKAWRLTWIDASGIQVTTCGDGGIQRVLTMLNTAGETGKAA